MDGKHGTPVLKMKNRGERSRLNAMAGRTLITPRRLMKVVHAWLPLFDPESDYIISGRNTGWKAFKASKFIDRPGNQQIRIPGEAGRYRYRIGQGMDGSFQRERNCKKHTTPRTGGVLLVNQV
jgi:hypothetical protein